MTHRTPSRLPRQVTLGVKRVVAGSNVLLLGLPESVRNYAPRGG